MSFSEYISAGWRLCAIPPGGKMPTLKGWNDKDRPQVAIPAGCGAGLMHVESQTCAIDIDQEDVAQAWLRARGVELASLLTAPSAVRISSGRAGRAKLLYSIGSPLRSIKTAPFKAKSPKTGKDETYTALDFRCATRDGLSLQDVLPPTIHPDTQKPYEWQYGDPLTGSWRNLPPLPPELRAIWEGLVDSRIVNNAPSAPKGAGFDEMRAILAGEDPNAEYNGWLEVGFALHHETQGSRDGLLLWNEWSANASIGDKYKGISDLEPHWRSFNSAAPDAVTLGTLRARQVASVEDFPLVLASTTPAAPPMQNIDLDALKSAYGYVSGSEAATAPDLIWIVGTQEEPLIPDSELGFVYGPPKGGKTSWLLDLVLHIAAGIPYRSLPVLQRNALYLAAEGWGGMRGAKGRYERARRRLDLPVDVPFSFLSRPPNFMSAEAVGKVATLVKHTGVKLVVVDTLARVIAGADENSAKEMSVFIEYCQSLHRITGAMVLIIAHSGKDEARGMRGTSAFDGAADVEIKVSRASEDVRVAEVERMKDGKEGGQYPFKLLDDGSLEHTDEVPKTRAVKSTSGAASVFYSACAGLFGAGAATSAPVDDVIEEMMRQSTCEPGEAERLRKGYRKSITQLCATAGTMFIIRDGLVVLKEVAGFELRPPDSAAGIDATLPAAQTPMDNSDILAGLSHG